MHLRLNALLLNVHRNSLDPIQRYRQRGGSDNMRSKTLPTVDYTMAGEMLSKCVLN